MNDTELAIQFAKFYIENCKKFKEWNEKYHIENDTALSKWETILQALEEKAERDNPKPLTLEQLNERICKPVYIVDHYNAIDSWFIVGNNDWYTDGYEDSDAVQLYGKTWFAYDYEPKESD